MNRFALIVFGFSVAVCTAQSARVPENDPGITYNGAWTRTANTGSTDGFYMVSNTAGNTVTFKFTGDSLVLYRYLDANGGQATVTIDGNQWGTLSFNFDGGQASQIPAVLDHLGAGPHTVVLTVAAPFGGGPAGNVTVDSFEFPTTFTPTANQTGALTAVNQIRTQAGLPPADLSTALDLAAQAHASYLATNNLGGHDETAGMPGYVGAQFGDRAQYFGYDRASFEVANPGGDSGRAVTNLWSATVYHRVPFLRYNLTDVGCGTMTIGQNGGGACDFGSRRGTAPAARNITTWPVDKATAVPLGFSAESPNPVPTVPSTSNLGYPISLHIAQPANVTMGTDTVAASATLTGPNNQQVMVAYLDRNNDPNANTVGILNGSDDYFMVPLQPLAPGTTYTANITGTDTQGHQFNQTWSFTTVAAATISLPFVNVRGASVYFQWSTAGPVTATQLQYGLTTTYGTVVMPQQTIDATRTTFSNTVTGIAPGTYHYQITATDANGVTFNTPDATFTVAPYNVAQVFIDFVGPSATGTSMFWHTNGPVTMTQVQYGTSTAYGTTVAGQTQTGNDPTKYFVSINGLTPATTYHFVISATDGTNNFTTPDQTFTTAAQ